MEETGEATNLRPTPDNYILESGETEIEGDRLPEIETCLPSVLARRMVLAIESTPAVRTIRATLVGLSWACTSLTSKSCLVLGNVVQDGITKLAAPSITQSRRFSIEPLVSRTAFSPCTRKH